MDFYLEHTHRYSGLSHEFTHLVYTGSSHLGLGGDMDLLCTVVELTPGSRGLDAGCGAETRNVYLLHIWGYEAYGVDAVVDNISWPKSSTRR